jgi:hypothetical protein
MKDLGSRDVVYVPTDREACPVCKSGLFAMVRRYFADTGEPIENGIHVGCIDCDVEIGGSLQNQVREWVCSNYRIKS